MAALMVTSAADAQTAPLRVVSMNLCTDQLAMMLADEGQLISVSDIAIDPNMSPMAEAARAYAFARQPSRQNQQERRHQHAKKLCRRAKIPLCQQQNWPEKQQVYPRPHRAALQSGLRRACRGAGLACPAGAELATKPFGHAKAPLL